MDAAVRDIAIKSILGGLMIALVLSLAKLKQFQLAGLLVSIPTISLYTFWWIGKEYGAGKMRVSIHAALWSALPWALYLLVAYLLAGRYPTWIALAGGVVTYLVTNSALLLLLRYFAG